METVEPGCFSPSLLAVGFEIDEDAFRNVEEILTSRLCRKHLQAGNEVG